MRTLVAALLLLVASTTGAKEIGYEGARHLLNRAGFGATDAEIRGLAPLKRDEAVDRLLAGARREESVAAPAFVHEPYQPFFRLIRNMNAEERMAEQRQRFQQGFELRAWWLREMLATPSPLTERMTLFWHGHFATSQLKVRSVQLMYRQNKLLRRESLGNFATLLRGISRDPAMLVYLDNAQSRREAPNENFARELMELFTLGEGNYGERDVKEAARALAGWSIDFDTGEFRKRPMFRDFGEKTVLGRTGRLDGDDVVDILLKHPRTAEFITEKLWRELVSPEPDSAEVRRLAAVFREAGYEVKPLLKAMLTSDAFWAAGNRASLVKSPVDIVIGTLRTFEIRPMDMRPAAFAVAALGQNLFTPPNVKGWPGGETWINAATLLGRKQWVERIFRGADAVAATAETAAMGEQAPMTAAAGPPAAGDGMRRALKRGMTGYAIERGRWSANLAEVLAAAPVNPVPADVDAASRMRALVFDPVFQLR